MCSTLLTACQDALEQYPDARDCLRDLFLTDPHEDRQGLKRKKGKPASGTCQWIFGTEELTAWLGSGQMEHSEGPPTQVLWLHGNPGTGKSTMAIYLTEALSSDFTATEGKTLSYFFCDSSFDRRKTATSIVRGLLLQLVQQHPQLLGYLLPKYKERGQELFDSFDALWAIFLDAVADRDTGRKYCIIDALDECEQESQKVLLQQLRTSFLGVDAPRGVQILVTSRPYNEIREYMHPFAQKDLASYPEAREDVHQCIEARVADLTERKRYTPKVRGEIVDILRDKAEGTFLWVGLACTELEGVHSKDAVKALQNMPKGLSSLYQKLLENAIRENGGDHGIRQILGTAAVSLQPLSLLELSSACQLYEDEDEETRTLFMREQVASCRLMVIIQDQKVLLLHQSVKDFLTEDRAGQFIDIQMAHADLACRCINVLIQNFNVGHQRPALSDYATMQWAEHAHLAQSRFQIEPSLAKFFAIKSRCRENWLQSYRDSTPNSSVPKQFSILHVAAQWGIEVLVDHALSQTANDPGSQLVDCIDNSGVTPLECAAASGHQSVVEKLLGLGANVTARLVQAVAANRRNGSKVMALLLDRRGDEITITEKVVEAAAANRGNGKEAMALLLDRRGDEITITEKVVEAAAGNDGNSTEVIALLLNQRGNEITITEKVVKAAAANWRNGSKVIALLLDRRGDAITITNEVVLKIAGSFDEEVMALLLDRRGDEITITEKVVEAAAGNDGNSTEVMVLLLNQRGNEITITEKVVEAAAANWRNGEEVIALLLNRRGDAITITDDVVSMIARSFTREVMALLLDRRGNEITITEKVVKAAAANRGNGKEVIALLLDRRGDEITITEKVVEAAAANRGNGKEVMALLLDRRGDEIRITDKALKAAGANTRSGQAMMTLLAERREDDNALMHRAVEIVMRLQW